MARKPRNRLLKLMATIRQRAPLLVGRGSVASSVQVNPLPPVFTVSPTSATYQSTALPQTLQFTATDPNGQTVSYGFVSTPSGYSIDSSTGLVTVNAGATSQSFKVRATDSTGLSTDSDTCAVTVQAATAETGTRRLTTNFGPGLIYTETDRWPDPYRPGAYYKITGTDQGTGFVYQSNAPIVYGQNLSESGTAGVTSIQMIFPDGTTPSGSGTANISNAYWVCRMEPTSGPNGEGAWYVNRLADYSANDYSWQCNWQFFPNYLNVAQGMVYVRFKFKLEAGYFNTTSGTWNRLVETKTNDSNGADRFFVEIQRVTTTTGRLKVGIDSPFASTSQYGGTFYDLPFGAWEVHAAAFSANFAEDAWHTLEYAFRLTPDTTGWIWAALDGVEITNFTKYANNKQVIGTVTYYSGQTLPAGGSRSARFNRLYAAKYYSDWKPVKGMWITNMVVQENGWPAGATTHPVNFT